MNRRLEWIILSLRLLNVFWRKYCRVLAKLVPMFFKCSCAFIFLTRSLIDRCQIMTDTCKNNVSKFVWKPFKSPLSLRKCKCFGEVSLFNLHHLHFKYHLVAQKLFSLWKILPYLQLNHSGSFGKNFVKFKKNKYATSSALPITTPSLTPTILNPSLWVRCGKKFRYLYFNAKLLLARWRLSEKGFLISALIQQSEIKLYLKTT